MIIPKKNKIELREEDSIAAFEPIRIRNEKNIVEITNKIILDMELEYFEKNKHIIGKIIANEAATIFLLPVSPIGGSSKYN